MIQCQKIGSHTGMPSLGMAMPARYEDPMQARAFQVELVALSQGGMESVAKKCSMLLLEPCVARTEAVTSCVLESSVLYMSC